VASSGLGNGVPLVGLFVTCLVDLIRPSVGFAAVKLLERCGLQSGRAEPTCCGQPAYNSGDRADTRAIGKPGDRGLSRAATMWWRPRAPAPA